MAETQYAYRSQKSSGLIDGHPSWSRSSTVAEDIPGVKTYAYSPNGQYYAYSLGTSVTIVSELEGVEPRTVQCAEPAVGLAFSPLSTYLFTYARPLTAKDGSGLVDKNLRIWSVADGTDVGGFYQKGMEGWEPLVTPTESHLIRLSSQSEISIYRLPSTNGFAKPTSKVRIDGSVKSIFLGGPGSSSTSVTEGLGSAVAVWIGERKGAPASIGLHSLTSLLPPSGTATDDDKIHTINLPTTQAKKAFYKADKMQVKWNDAGTMALFLTHTDVDVSGKSYYGETNLYLVAVNGQFDSIVELDKEGPISDFAWSPNSREFSVCYGYMPARTVVFDARAKPVHSFGSGPHNFLLYQPQGKLLLVAGFGNLQGGVDVLDVSTRKKIASFKSSNASVCEWSPCGRYILTATLSPRLRVDNCVKVFWCGGQLLHVQPENELYQASWRPRLPGTSPAFPAVIPPAPAAHDSVKLHQPAKETTTETKPAGAYRPPGARGALAPDVFKREDEGGPSHMMGSSGASSPNPMFRGGKPAQRYVPGAPPPGSAPEPKKTGKKAKKVANGGPPPELAPPIATPAADPQGEADPTAKKIRNLTKKLKAIEELKEKVKKGDKMEKTQLKKIEAEAEVRKEIAALEATL